MMTNKSLALDDRLYNYLLSVSLRESEVLRNLREETARLPQAGMQISPEQGQFMALLVKLTGAKRILEIGVFTGYSSIAMAEALPDDGVLTALDMDKEWTSIARRYWQLAGVSDKVDLRLGPALNSLDLLIEEGRVGHYDLIFIDADKTGYEGYFERALVLVRPGGLVLLDNLLWGGKPADPNIVDPDTQAIRALNLRLRSDPRIRYCLLPVADGLGLAYKL
jgi:predicted O-methyltransferase YrrM